MKKGFTLIELIIVILIIGILTTFAIPTYKRIILKVRTSSASATIQSIVFAQERYKVENGAFYVGVKNENKIAEELKIKLSKSNNFNYFINDEGDGNFTIKAVLRDSSWDVCGGSTTLTTICKENGTMDEDDWVQQYNRGEDKHYLEFRYPNKLSGEYVEGGISYEHLYDD